MDIILIVLIIYLAFMFLIAWYFSRKESIEAYFLNKRKTSLWLMTFSTVATIVGAGATVAVVSETYNTGISYGLAIPISLLFGVIILGLLAPRIKSIGDKYGAHTIVDFFEKRFDVKNKILTGFLQIVLLLFWIATQAVAISSLATVLIGIDFQIALMLTAIVTILYTTIGGLKVDIITDFIQFWIIFIMFSVLAIIGYLEVGSISNLISQLPEGHLNPFAFGGVSWFVGAVLLSGLLYMANTIHWQRIFSADSVKTAKKSFFLSIPFVFLLGLFALFFGLLASVLLTGINQDTAIFSLMNKLLPNWLLGIGFASILAVIMSSIDSLLVGGSTIIYRGVFRKNEFSNKKEILYARLITALFGIMGFLIAFLIPNIVTLSLFTVYMTLVFIPAIFAGLYSKRISSDASFYSILASFVLLIITFPIIGANSFIAPFILAILIILFYDKIFKKKDKTPLKYIGVEE